MKMQFIKSSEKKEIISQLNNQFGITDLPFLLIESGKEKIRGFSGHLSKDEIIELGKILNIEVIGLYLIKKEENIFRLSLDATHLLKEQIIKNIIEIDDSQLKEWIRGQDLDIKTQKGIVIIKHASDFIGCGKSSGDKIFNYIPKERRIKKQTATDI